MKHNRYTHKLLALALCLGLVVVLGLTVLFCGRHKGGDQDGIKGRLAPANPHAEPDDQRLTVRFYMIMFAYEDALNLAGHSHLFASFLKTQKPGRKDLSPGDIEIHTISWLPKDLKEEVDLLTGKPEPGRNYTLAETLQSANIYGFKIEKWGAFEIPQWLFDRAIEDIAVLDSGLVMYLANDTDESHRRAYLRQEGGGENCIHAVSDLIKFHNVGLNWGPPAARLVLKEDFMPFIMHPDVANMDIPRLLGLDWISEGD